jgi:superkiller protein 3
MIYTAITDWPDALAAYRESLRLDPGDADTWFMLGRAYFLRDDFPGARETFETSLRLNPQQIRGYENLALTLDLMNQAGTADETYRQGIKSAQEHKYSDAQIYVDYGKFLAKHERAAESLRQLREAVRVAPQNPEAHGELANQIFRMIDPRPHTIG